MSATTNQFNQSFSCEEIRKKFIQKVFLIVAVQLIITVIVCATLRYGFDWSSLSPETYQILLYCMYGILILYVVLSITLICCQQFMRKFPYNFICLFLFTLCLSVLTGITTIQQKTSLILVAFGMALLITGGLIAFAFQTKYDFTTKNSLICVLLFSLIAFGICTSFWHSKMMHVLYCTMGFVLFSFILVFDVQLIIGGKHQYAFSEEDYIFAAFVLYLDIINLFLMILGMGRR